MHTPQHRAVYRPDSVPNPIPMRAKCWKGDLLLSEHAKKLSAENLSEGAWRQMYVLIWKCVLNQHNTRKEAFPSCRRPAPAANYFHLEDGIRHQASKSSHPVFGERIYGSCLTWVCRTATVSQVIGSKGPKVTRWLPEGDVKEGDTIDLRNRRDAIEHDPCLS